MKMIGSLIIVVGAALLFGCAASVPSELAGARQAYLHASAGPAAQLAPVELHKAEQALAQAETSFSKDGKSYRTRDLAYVAQRKAELADVQASIASQQTSRAQSDKAFEVTQGNMLQEKTQDLSDTRTALAESERSGQATSQKLSAEQTARLEAEQRTAAQSRLTQETTQNLNQTRTALAVSERSGQATTQDLNQTRTALAVSERSGQATADQLSAEQTARVAAEQRTAAALVALAKLAAVKEEARGLVITLSGSVLFRSDEATLMPGAELKLNQVAEALLASKTRNVVVEGFTDSQGADQYNIDLSQRRADAVRTYLVQRGYDAARIQGHGIGEGRPVADNATAEGRANNRRVEITLEREAKL